jgi:ABC-type sugar transport system, periplasmic component
MKKIAMFFSCCAILMLFASCTESGAERYKKTDEPLAIQVLTPFAGNSGKAKTYQNVYREWEEMSESVVNDRSFELSRSYKERVDTEFKTDSEPDVLFYFTGAAADSFVSAKRVMSIEEIREEFPDYAKNYNKEELPLSGIDEEPYAVPLGEEWTALFVNKKVLEAAGVEMPGADYTWTQFLADCEKIKESGFVPIAAAFGDFPYYWWEYIVMNQSGASADLSETDLEKVKQKSIREITNLYTAGYLPEETIHIKSEECFDMFMQGEAAFFADTSWCIDRIEQKCGEELTMSKLEDFGVTYFPGSKNRKAAEIICDVSMGFYITKKAWNNSEKRKAAEDFVRYVTSDEIVPRFTDEGLDLLVKKPKNSGDENILRKQANEMIEKAVSRNSVVWNAFGSEFDEDITKDIVKELAEEIAAE